MAYDVRIETIVEPLPTAVVRRRARLNELSRVVPEACGVVWGALKAAKVSGAGRHVALYVDCDVEGPIELEVGVEMERPFEGVGEVVGSTLPAGRVATAVHMGPYQELHHAHVAIRDWCARNGYAIAGPNWELYGHWEKAWEGDASRIRTDVYYLLK